MLCTKAPAGWPETSPPRPRPEGRHYIDASTPLVKSVACDGRPGEATAMRRKLSRLCDETKWQAERETAEAAATAAASRPALRWGRRTRLMWLAAPPRLHPPPRPRGPLLLLVRPKGLTTKAKTLFLTEEEVRGEVSTPCLMQRPPLNLVSGWFKWRWGWNIEAPNFASGREPAHPRNAGPRSPNES